MVCYSTRPLLQQSIMTEYYYMSSAAPSGDCQHFLVS